MTPEETQALMDKIEELNKTLEPLTRACKAAIIPNATVVKWAEELGITPQELFDRMILTTKPAADAENK